MKVNETSIKTQKGWDLESFLVGEHVKILEEWHAGEGMEAPCPFPHTFPVHLFHVAVPEFYLFITNH